MSGELRLVGLEELSAGVLRNRLLARRAEFWSGSPLDDEAVVALHDPLFFHQLGGFGAVARAPEGHDPQGEDAGYLLGLVSADGLAVVHAVAVHPAWRRRGIARRLVDRFAVLAAGVGARAAQAVAVPQDDAARGLARAFGAHETAAPAHAGPGADRVLFTRSLPLA